MRGVFCKQSRLWELACNHLPLNSLASGCFASISPKLVFLCTRGLSDLETSTEPNPLIVFLVTGARMLPASAINGYTRDIGTLCPSSNSG